MESACGDPNGCSGWVLSPKVLLLSFCWLFMAWNEEELGPEVSSEWLLWGSSFHYAASWGWSCRMGCGTAKASMGTRMALEDTQPCQGMQG